MRNHVKTTEVDFIFSRDYSKIKLGAVGNDLPVADNGRHAAIFTLQSVISQKHTGNSDTNLQCFKAEQSFKPFDYG